MACCRAAVPRRGLINPTRPEKMKSAVLVTISLAAALGVSLGGTIGGSARAAEGVRVDLVDRTSLRVCADPANMPFSNEKGEGFENKIGRAAWSESEGMKG